MSEVVGRALVAIALPLAVFIGGAWIMAHMSGREQVMRKVRIAVPLEDQKPLNQRLHYDVGAVQRHWKGLDETGRAAERLFLELDLIFPFLYGAALATSLLVVCGTLGRPFAPAWIIVPVAMTVVADWTENLTQLAQLRRYVRLGAEALQGGWIAVASAATLVKLVFFGVTSVGLVVLVAVMLFQGPKSQ